MCAPLTTPRARSKKKKGRKEMKLQRVAMMPLGTSISALLMRRPLSPGHGRKPRRWKMTPMRVEGEEREREIESVGKATWLVAETCPKAGADSLWSCFRGWGSIWAAHVAVSVVWHLRFYFALALIMCCCSREGVWWVGLWDCCLVIINSHHIYNIISIRFHNSKSF